LGGLPVALWITDTTTPPAVPPGLYYRHLDHLGGLHVLTDAAGVVTKRLTYYPFGEPRPSTATGELEFDRHRFTGQELDSTTELYDYGARYYNPALGRFLSPDSLVPDPGNPQSLNRYSYVRNNSLARIDPTGHQEAGIFDGEIESPIGNNPADFTGNFGNASDLVWEPQVFQLAAADIVFDGTLIVSDAVSLRKNLEQGNTLPAITDATSLALNAVCAAIPGATACGPIFRTVLEAVRRGLGYYGALDKPLATGTTSGDGTESRGPDFAVTPKGDAILVPSGATGPTSRKVLACNTRVAQADMALTRVCPTCGSWIQPHLGDRHQGILEAM
jgi:RHS repeat-associated protein